MFIMRLVRNMSSTFFRVATIRLCNCFTLHLLTSSYFISLIHCLIVFILPVCIYIKHPFYHIYIIFYPYLAVSMLHVINSSSFLDTLIIVLLLLYTYSMIITFLGLPLDSHLLWKFHTSVLVKKLNLACFIMRKLSYVLNIDTLRIVYFAHF